LQAAGALTGSHFGLGTAARNLSSLWNPSSKLLDRTYRGQKGT